MKVHKQSQKQNTKQHTKQNTNQKTKQHTTEEVATILICLRQIVLDEGYSNIVVNEQLKGSKLDHNVAARVRKVVYGTLENWIYLESWLGSLAHKSIKSDIKLLLMAGLYELNFLSGTFDHVIVNRYLAAVETFAPHAKAFVNAIFRNAQRQPLTLTHLKPQEYLSITYSYPMWLVGKLLKRFGQAETQALLEAGQMQRPLYLRVEADKMSVDAVVQMLEQAGVSVTADKWLNNALAISHLGPNRLEALEPFADGLVTVQDVSSMLVGHVARPEAGDKWLDLCAAPGGKATDLASRCGAEGRVVACDIHPHKLDLIIENARRLGLENLSARLGDASVVQDEFFEAFDGVLLDAPCSGMGIIGRKPEIKLRKRPDDIVGLVDIQKRMLELAAAYVKPGGYLIYSTCTIFSEENEAQIERFLEARTDYERVDLSIDLPADLPVVHRDALAQGMVHLRQSNGWSDGFFIAKLKRLALEG